MNALTFCTESPEQTERVGEWMARNLPDGAVLALRGDLAAGKTCCVRGMARSFGASDAVHSPTFTLVNQYGTARRLYHLDLYRLAGPEEVADLGHEELFEPDGICVVEWADRAEKLLPRKRVDMLLSHAGGDKRNVTIQDLGILGEDWQRDLQEFLSASTAS